MAVKKKGRHGGQSDETGRSYDEGQLRMIEEIAEKISKTVLSSNSTAVRPSSAGLSPTKSRPGTSLSRPSTVAGKRETSKEEKAVNRHVRKIIGTRPIDELAVADRMIKSAVFEEQPLQRARLFEPKNKMKARQGLETSKKERKKRKKQVSLQSHSYTAPRSSSYPVQEAPTSKKGSSPFSKVFDRTQKNMERSLWSAGRPIEKSVPWLRPPRELPSISSRLGNGLLPESLSGEDGGRERWKAYANFSVFPGLSTRSSLHFGVDSLSSLLAYERRKLGGLPQSKRQREKGWVEVRATADAGAAPLPPYDSFQDPHCRILRSSPFAVQVEQNMATHVQLRRREKDSAYSLFDAVGVGEEYSLFGGIATNEGGRGSAFEEEERGRGSSVEMPPFLLSTASFASFDEGLPRKRPQSSLSVAPPLRGRSPESRLRTSIDVRPWRYEEEEERKARLVLSHSPNRLVFDDEEEGQTTAETTGKEEGGEQEGEREGEGRETRKLLDRNATSLSVDPSRSAVSIGDEDGHTPSEILSLNLPSMNAEDQLEDAAKEIEKLWKDLKIPPKEQEKFRDIFLRNALSVFTRSLPLPKDKTSSFSAASLNEPAASPLRSIMPAIYDELRSLRTYKSQTLGVLRALDLFAASLRAFGAKAIGFERARQKYKKSGREIAASDEFKTEVGQILFRLVRVSVLVVEAVRIWRSSLLLPRAFVWKGANALWTVKEKWRDIAKEPLVAVCGLVPSQSPSTTTTTMEDKEKDTENDKSEEKGKREEGEPLFVYPRSLLFQSNGVGKGEGDRQSDGGGKVGERVTFRDDRGVEVNAFLPFLSEKRVRLAEEELEREEELQRKVKGDIAAIEEKGFFVPTLRVWERHIEAIEKMTDEEESGKGQLQSESSLVIP